MNKHTPGPWYIGADSLGHSRHIYAVEKTYDGEEEWNPLIATTCDDEPATDFEANARLIAAAPDLLETLEELLSEAEDGIATCPLTRDKARAAIAKARGQE